jgi:hypothetical protein
MNPAGQLLISSGDNSPTLDKQWRNPEAKITQDEITEQAVDHMLKKEARSLISNNQKGKGELRLVPVGKFRESCVQRYEEV